MTPKKIMPKTLSDLNSNPLMTKIMDRSENLDEIIDKVKKFWSFDMYSRTPSQTLNGKTKETNLDLACVFYSLAERSANITIPNYKSLRPKGAGDPTAKGSRTGKIVSISSNKDLFSFSVKIFDESVNEYRSFCITDPRGNFYLKEFTWDPTEKENAYLSENQVAFDHQISFKNFVHPNRWTSFYGQKYFVTKALIQRITDECKDMYSQIKNMQKNGITYPKSNDQNSKPWPQKLKVDGKPVVFKSLEVEVDFPMFNEFKQFVFSQEILVYLTDLRKYYIYSLLPILRFATRCTELAFFKYGNNTKLPSWLGGGVKWESEFKLPRKKIVWDRLKIVQPAVGVFSLGIRKRIREKSEIMAHDFELNGLYE